MYTHLYMFMYINIYIYIHKFMLCIFMLYSYTYVIFISMMYAYHIHLPFDKYISIYPNEIRPTRAPGSSAIFDFSLSLPWSLTEKLLALSKLLQGVLAHVFQEFPRWPRLTHLPLQFNHAMWLTSWPTTPLSLFNYLNLEVTNSSTAGTGWLSNLEILECSQCSHLHQKLVCTSSCTMKQSYTA